MTDPPDKIKQWQVLSETEPISYKIFSLRWRTVRHPEFTRDHDFVIMESPDWVNMIVLTEDGEVVLVRQYRHGVSRDTIEIPGGMVDPGETPRETATRELLEETGYVCKSWHAIGVVEPNPAFQTNRCWTYLGLGATQKHEQKLDGTEIIEVSTAPLSEISRMMQRGEITHSLVIAAFFHYLEQCNGWNLPNPEMIASFHPIQEP